MKYDRITPKSRLYECFFFFCSCIVCLCAHLVRNVFTPCWWGGLLLFACYQQKIKACSSAWEMPPNWLSQYTHTHTPIHTPLTIRGAERRGLQVLQGYWHIQDLLDWVWDHFHVRSAKLGLKYKSYLIYVAWSIHDGTRHRAFFRVCVRVFCSPTAFNISSFNSVILRVTGIHSANKTEKLFYPRAVLFCT